MTSNVTENYYAAPQTVFGIEEHIEITLKLLIIWIPRQQNADMQHTQSRLPSASPLSQCLFRQGSRLSVVFSVNVANLPSDADIVEAVACRDAA